MGEDDEPQQAPWSAAIAEWTVWLTSASRSVETIRLRTYHLHRLSRLAAAPADVDAADLAQFLTSLRAPATRRSFRASFRQFFHWALSVGIVSSDPTAQLLPPPPIRTLPRPAPDDVILAALHRSSPRVRLMLLLAAEAGLRRAEIARMHTSSITQTGDRLDLWIDGKGRRQRVVPASPRLALELRWYLSRTPEGYLFPSPRRPGPIGAIRVGELVSAALPDGIACHHLRHRFATATYAASHDLLLVQQLMGHAKPETTAAYVALDTTTAADIVRAASLAA